MAVKYVSVKYKGGAVVVLSNRQWMPDLTLKPGESYDLPEEVAAQLAGRGDFEVNPAGLPPQEPKKKRRRSTAGGD
ncbi:MAG: hypothetical protein V3S82_10400 [Dehalococcoidia bacterium]